MDGFGYPNSFDAALETSYGKARLHKIQKVKVGIAGAGGLGSNCAMHLVRNGVRKLKIADFDRVEWSNLNRQFYFAGQVGRYKVDALKDNLRAINRALEPEMWNMKLTRDNLDAFLEGCDILIEAMDSAENKTMFVTAVLKKGKPVIAASGIAGYGRAERIEGRRFNNLLYVVGDFESEVDRISPPYSAIVGLAAARQADAVIQMILDGQLRWDDN